METLDVVDKSDKIIGKASYKEIYDKLLLHRIVHVFIFNDRDEIALQLRSKHKGFCPQHWSTAVGGHVRSGESHEEAALREMEEEAGVRTNLSFLRKDLYTSKNYDGRGDLKKILTTFKAFHNGPFKINPKEVEKIEFFNVERIQQMIDRGEKFHPELLFLLEKHFKIKKTSE